MLQLAGKAAFLVGALVPVQAFHRAHGGSPVVAPFFLQRALQGLPVEQGRDAPAVHDFGDHEFCQVARRLRAGVEREKRRAPADGPEHGFIVMHAPRVIHVDAEQFAAGNLNGKALGRVFGLFQLVDQKGGPEGPDQSLDDRNGPGVGGRHGLEPGLERFHGAIGLDAAVGRQGLDRLRMLSQSHGQPPVQGVTHEIESLENAQGVGVDDHQIHVGRQERVEHVEMRARPEVEHHEIGLEPAEFSHQPEFAAVMQMGLAEGSGRAADQGKVLDAGAFRDEILQGNRVGFEEIADGRLRPAASEHRVQVRAAEVRVHGHHFPVQPGKAHGHGGGYHGLAHAALAATDRDHLRPVRFRRQRGRPAGCRFFDFSPGGHFHSAPDIDDARVVENHHQGRRESDQIAHDAEERLSLQRHIHHVPGQYVRYLLALSLSLEQVTRFE